jgi:hypothetical protein
MLKRIQIEYPAETFGLLKLLVFFSSSCVSSVSSRSFLRMILLLCAQLLLLFFFAEDVSRMNPKWRVGMLSVLFIPQASRGCACLFCAPPWKARFWICGVCDGRGFKDSTDCEADRQTDRQTDSGEDVIN